jgi:hypothetical protein
LRGVSFGHLTLPIEEVSTLSWDVSIGETPLADGETLAVDWTYYDDIYIKCSFQLDLRDALTRLRLSSSARLGAVIIARSSGTPLIATSEVRDVRGGRQQVYLTLPADQISGTLSLEFQISVLAIGHAVESPFAPKRLGNTVFRVDRKIVLEGTAPRLPILPVSFAEHGIAGANNSLWWLRLTSRDLAASASAAIWLWLNADNPIISRMLEDSDSSDSAAWLRFLELDFMRQLLREALSSDELSLQADYPEGSLGYVLSSVARLLGESLDQLQQRYREDPGRVEAELQSKVGAK